MKDDHKKTLLALCLLLGGCATYQTQMSKLRQQLRSGQYETVLKELKPLAQGSGDDQLAYLLEYATALQIARQYNQSKDEFIYADRLSEVKDYHSLSRIAGSLLLNEGMVQYKGEDYEKVLLNAFSAIDFLMLNNLSDALVEVRRLNEKLYRYKVEAKRNYAQNVFAKYISGVIWEADKKWDDAYIDYNEAYQLNPHYAPLANDLIRTARLSHRVDDLEKWQKKFRDIQWEPAWSSKEYGELVVIYQQGWGPAKQPHPNTGRFPKLYPVHSQTQFAEIQVSGKSYLAQQIYSIEEVAIKTLDDAYAGLIAKRIAGVVAKEVVADQIRQKNEVLGFVAWLGLHLSDRADLRQWSFLPATLHIARIFLKAGDYHLKIVGKTATGGLSGEAMSTTPIRLVAGKKLFVNWRSLQ